jgi:hypothetical protein
MNYNIVYIIKSIGPSSLGNQVGPNAKNDPFDI